MLKSPVTSNAVLLASFALVTALLLAGTHIGTREQIALSERQAAEKALLEIIPEQRHSNDLLADTLPVSPITGSSWAWQTAAIFMWLDNTSEWKP